MWRLRIYSLFVILMLSSKAFCQKVDIYISNIKSYEGNIQVDLFTSQEQLDSEEPESTFVFDKSKLKNGQQKVTIPLGEGTYGITVLDDEDKDGEMSFSMGIYPKEGIGFSGFYLEGLTKPTFSDFSFYKKKKRIKFQVELKYF
mgnify:CR=1 FL=1